MKKFLVLTLMAAFCLVISAQDNKDAKADSTKCNKEMKEHVCTSACKDGKHVYAHGEKGHECTDACMKEKK